MSLVKEVTTMLEEKEIQEEAVQEANEEIKAEEKPASTIDQKAFQEQVKKDVEKDELDTFNLGKDDLSLENEKEMQVDDLGMSK